MYGSVGLKCPRVNWVLKPLTVVLLCCVFCGMTTQTHVLFKRGGASFRFLHDFLCVCFAYTNVEPKHSFFPPFLFLLDFGSSEVEAFLHLFILPSDWTIISITIMIKGFGEDVRRFVLKMGRIHGRKESYRF